MWCPSPRGRPGSRLYPGITWENGKGEPDMATFSWTAVEDAVLAALEARVGPLIQTLKTYQGDWLGELQRQRWRLPAGLLLLGKSPAEQKPARSFDVILDFRLLVVVRQLRGEEAGRREEGG